MANMDTKNFYWLAFNMIPGIGCKTTRQLLEVVEEPENLFSETRNGLEAIFGNRTKIIDAIVSKSMFDEAERELKFATDNNIDILTYDNPKYPQRLKRAECDDCPTVLFYKGSAELNMQKVVSIVGTRKVTEYGKKMVDELVGGMMSEGILVVSGLAYGVDTCSHKAALQYGLPTVGVLGHGLNMIYPAENRNLAKDMLACGGLLTEYSSQTKLETHNFPARNRIIAALSDAVIVIEAAKKGGALITAEIANGYNREVFSVPGKVGDTYSEGCNNLIKNHKANLIQTVQDMYYVMGWKNNKKTNVLQTSLFPELNADEKVIYDLLLQNSELTLDEFVAKSDLSLPKIASILLNLELKNIIVCLPGKKYKIM